MGSDRDQSCEDRVEGELERELETLRTLWHAYQRGRSDPDEGDFTEHGLSFDFVAPGTFNGQREPYFRYQISWGGPSDEFRFYCGGPDCDPHRVEYWFLDWGDGASRTLEGRDEVLLLEIWDWFKEVGAVRSEYAKAME